jgi:phosphoglycerate dehydrogenase-like enzyme
MIKSLAILDDYQGAAFSQPYWKQLQGRVELEAYRDTLHDEEPLVERLRPYQILVPIRERTQFSERILEQLPALELLSLTGKNSGQVDLAAATAQGILVTQTSGSGATAIEMTMALMLALAHRVAPEDRAMRQGLWQTGIGFDLAGKTLGILGLGRIGSRIASFGNHLGMRVLAWSANLTEQKAAAAGATYAPLDDLFRQSDIVTLHLRLSDRTREIVTARHLALMKPTACLVNTARGYLVDENALVAALRDKRIAGAALDVFQTEPLPEAHPLRSLENVVLSPHMGYVSAESYNQFFRAAVDNIDAYLSGRVPAGALNPEVLTDGRSRRKPAVTQG